MLSLDQDWLSAHYQPLHVMFPDPGYASPVRRDQDSSKSNGGSRSALCPRGANTDGQSGHDAVPQSRVGVMVLIKTHSNDE